MSHVIGTPSRTCYIAHLFTDGVSDEVHRGAGAAWEQLGGVRCGQWGAGGICRPGAYRPDIA
ncbi:hypothetical protein MPLSOD_40639 [Mesorhizobium sp. SOD10]|nr:hypothetical protein MPLSOD_40639 [Mesorhizobium sp. SOD10]